MFCSVEGTGLNRPHVVLGVTSHQTCTLLSARAKALQAAGFRVSVLSGPGTILDDAIRGEGITAYELEIQRGVSILNDLAALISISRLIRRLRPDIVEFSTPKIGLLGCVASWICRVPVRIYFLRGLRLETSSGLKRWILGNTERIAAACSHLVLCNSDSLRKRAVELSIAPASKLAMLGSGSTNGVDVHRFSPGATQVRRQFGIPAGASVIGFVGRLTADKGLPELLEAFAGISRSWPDAYLLLVGWFDASEDALQRNLRERIESHPQVVFTGYVVDTAPFYRAMDILVLPTWREGFPNAALEAAATGIPVVSTFSTGACDAVVPEVTGLLVPPGYPESICEACLTLLGNEERSKLMGAAAREWVKNNFAEERVLNLTTTLYARLLKGGRVAAVQAGTQSRQESTGVPASM
jgi:glycosyltransferase involved in cell wall biosynthesis